MNVAFLWLVLFATGGLVSVYLYKSNIKGAGLFTGSSSLVLGTIGVVTSFVGLDWKVSQSILIAWSFSLVTTGYLALRTPKVLLLLIFPSFFLLQALMPSLSFLTLFAGVAVLMGGVNATDFSRLDVTACMRNADRPLRVLLVPFSRLENLIRRGLSPGKARLLLFSSYLLLSFLLVSLSVLAYLASGGVVLIGMVLLLGCTAYFSIARQECAKGSGRLKGSSQGADRGDQV